MSRSEKDGCPYEADECPKISALAKDLKSLKNMTFLITIVIVYYHGVEIMKWFV